MHYLYNQFAENNTEDKFLWKKYYLAENFQDDLRISSLMNVPVLLNSAVRVLLFCLLIYLNTTITVYTIVHATAHV
eukprot:snap_masked-scaffold_13-processed-gene-3.28-mRNA-1 protein AED:1.00 eAED:1.00 QI:0/0/0/0/1/1/2/0/75